MTLTLPKFTLKWNELPEFLAFAISNCNLAVRIQAVNEIMTQLTAKRDKNIE